MGDLIRELSQRAGVAPPGHAFGKFAWLLLKHADHDSFISERECARFDLTAPEISRVVKSAMAAGTTTDPTWAQSLASYAPLSAEFVELTTRLSLYGRLLADARRIPFASQTLIESDHFSAGWTAEGEPLPFSKATFGATASLPLRKTGCLIPFVNESFESFSPATLANLLASMRRALVYALDLGLLDPSYAASTSRPASLTNGLSPTQSTGPSAAQCLADFTAMIQSLLDQGSDPANLRIAMSPTTALFLAGLQTASGTLAFPQMSAIGGTIFGTPVFVGTSAAQVGSPETHLIVAVDVSKILIADDNLITADVSTAASLVFDDDPSPGAAEMVSLFQTGTRVLRLLRYLNYQRAHDSAVAWFPVAY